MDTTEILTSPDWQRIFEHQEILRRMRLHVSNIRKNSPDYERGYANGQLDLIEWLRDKLPEVVAPSDDLGQESGRRLEAV